MADKSCKGTYVLIMELDRNRIIKVGKLGTFKFPRGFYTYVGSAFGPGGLKARVGRHLRKDKKKKWHIDYFLRFARIVEVLATPKKCEKELAGKLLKHGKCVVKRFGSTDDKINETHLIFFSKNNFQKLHSILGFSLNEFHE